MEKHKLVRYAACIVASLVISYIFQNALFAYYKTCDTGDDYNFYNYIINSNGYGYPLIEWLYKPLTACGSCIYQIGAMALPLIFFSCLFVHKGHNDLALLVFCTPAFHILSEANAQMLAVMFVCGALFMDSFWSVAMLFLASISHRFGLLMAVGMGTIMVLHEYIMKIPSILIKAAQYGCVLLLLAFPFIAPMEFKPFSVLNLSLFSWYLITVPFFFFMCRNYGGFWGYAVIFGLVSASIISQQFLPMYDRAFEATFRIAALIDVFCIVFVAHCRKLDADIRLNARIIVWLAFAMAVKIVLDIISWKTRIG